MTIKSLGSLWCIFLIAFPLTCLVDYAVAQGNTADLQGVITDPSGANVSGARIRLENAAVGLVRETTSSETGEYRFLSLPPARYKIQVEAKGITSDRGKLWKWRGNWASRITGCFT